MTGKPHCGATGLVAALVLGTSFVVPVRAAEVILQNDTIPPGTALPTFISGERVASWFTVPTSGDIVGVQILWGSVFGGAATTIETAITVSAAGTFPTPGTPLATIVAPSLVDMTAPNEFRFLDPPTNSNPLKVPVTAGQVIVVDLEFFNTNSGSNFAGTIEHDGDGIQTGVNSVFSSGVWTDASLLGVPGDFGIRAILDPIPEPSGFVLVLCAAGFLVLRRCR